MGYTPQPSGARCCALSLGGMVRGCHTMELTDRILSNPANQGILACLKHLTRNWKGPMSCHPSKTHDPYYQLGTHPDLVQRLWDTLTVALPADCRWVLHSRPVLVHPETGTVFAFATGSQTYAFRIPLDHRPPPELADVIYTHEYPGGNVLDLSDFDASWFFAGHLKDEENLCLVAYESAARAA